MALLSEPVRDTVVEQAVAESEPAEIAVLVYDGVEMRFEMLDVKELGMFEMEFSLQPVVRNSMPDGLW